MKSPFCQLRCALLFAVAHHSCPLQPGPHIHHQPDQLALRYRAAIGTETRSGVPSTSSSFRRRVGIRKYSSRLHRIHPGCDHAGWRSSLQLGSCEYADDLSLGIRFRWQTAGLVQLQPGIAARSGRHPRPRISRRRANYAAAANFHALRAALSRELHRSGNIPEDWIWGNGLAGEVTPSTAENFVAFADDTSVKLEAKIKIKETDVEAIDEEINGCGPGGAARSLRYLAQQKLITLNQTGQQVYNTLKTKNYMNTRSGRWRHRDDECQFPER